MAPRPRLALLALAALLALPTAQARAWTEAHVQSASAEVTVSRDAHAVVALDLSVRVHGGWLEALEVAGLDPDLSLADDRPPLVLGEDGVRYVPDVHVQDGGRVELRFKRREAPRRGTYQVALKYHTDLAHRGTEVLEGGAIRVRWTLPGWRAGLDGVRITMNVPPGSKAHVREAEGHTFTREQQDRGDHTLISFRRAHLPRTIPWTVEVDVPRHRMDPAVAVPLAPTGTDAETEVEAEPPEPPAEEATATEGEPALPALTKEDTDRVPWLPNTAALLLCLLVALLGTAKVLTWSRACSRARAEARPILPLGPPFLRALLVLLLAAAAAVVWAMDPAFGLAVMGLATLPALERTPRVQALARPGAFRRATGRDRRLATLRVMAARLVGRAWLDLTTPGGVLVLGAGLYAVYHHAGPDDTALHYGMIIPALIMLTGTRHKLPRMAEERLLSLAKLARSLEVRLDEASPVALELLIHEDAKGRWQDARLGIVGAAPPPGLLRLHVAFAARRHLGGFDDDPQLLAVTRAHTPGDRLLSSRWPEATRLAGPGERIACTQSLDAATLGRAQDLASARPSAAQ